MVVVSKLTYERISPFYEENTSPSQTVPDDCLTIRELFERYKRGDVLHIRHDGEYEDELTDDDLDRDFVLDGVPVDRMEVELSSKNYERRIRYSKRKNRSDSRGSADVEGGVDSIQSSGVESFDSEPTE